MADRDIDALVRLATERGWSLTKGRRVHDCVLAGAVVGVPWRLSASLDQMEGQGMDELRFATEPFCGDFVLQAESRSTSVSSLGSADAVLAVVGVALVWLGKRAKARKPHTETPEHPLLPDLTVVDPHMVLMDPGVADLIRQAPRRKGRPVPSLRGGEVGLGTRPAGFALIARGRMDDPEGVIGVIAAGETVVRSVAARL